MGGKTLASCSYSSANIINVTQVILPVEIVLCIVSCNVASFSRLQVELAITIFIGTRKGLVHNFPRCNITISSLHHTINPSFQGRGKSFLLFLICKRNGIRLSNLANSNRMNIQSSISCLRLKNDVIITTFYFRHFDFYRMTTCSDRHFGCNSLSCAIPTILHGEFYTTCILIRSKV